MMHGHEKSDPVIVAGKLTNKAERSAAESVERRAETKGNVDQQRTRRTQRRIKSRMKVSDRITSSSARIDFLRPTKRGAIMCGNTTRSRSGSTG